MASRLDAGGSSNANPAALDSLGSATSAGGGSSCVVKKMDIADIAPS